MGIESMKHLSGERPAAKPTKRVSTKLPPSKASWSTASCSWKRFSWVKGPSFYPPTGDLSFFIYVVYHLSMIKEPKYHSTEGVKTVKSIQITGVIPTYPHTSLHVCLPVQQLNRPTPVAHLTTKPFRSPCAIGEIPPAMLGPKPLDWWASPAVNSATPPPEGFRG